jgi:hypothetical protein
MADTYTEGMKRHSLPISLAAALAIVGCKDEPQTGGGDKGAAPAATAPVGGHAKAGAKQVLGNKSAGGYELKGFQSGPIEEGDLDLVITGAGKPKAVRFWVGVESGHGSVKALAEEETPGNWHVHPEVPKPLPPDAKFWAEVEPPTGEKFKVAFDVKR